MSVVVVVQLVDDGKPDFEVAGQTRCKGCSHWCWLDTDSFRIILRKRVVPLCIPCAATKVTADRLIGNVKDFR